MIKKAVFSLLLVAFVFSSMIFPFANSVNAAESDPGSGAPEEGTWFNQNFVQWADKVYDPNNPDEIFGERYTAAQVSWIIYGVIAFFLNNLGDPGVNWCIARGIVNSSGGELNPDFLDITAFFNSIGCAQYYETPITAAVSAIQRLLSLITYDTSTSVADNFYTVRYVKGIASNVHLIPEVNAQGFGYQAIDIIQGLWSAVRNLTYFLLVLATIVLAFLVMFRAKISPQSVVTVQSAIPKIVIALILVTFSYAISGFLIDIMYLTLGLLTTILSSEQAGILSGVDWGTLWNRFTEFGLILWFIDYWTRFWFSFVNIFGMLMIAFQQMAEPVAGSAVTEVASNTIVGIGATLGFFIMALVAIATIIILLKFMFFLVKNYLAIILQITFSPIFIVGGVLQGGGISSWVRNMLGLLAVYPVTALLLVGAFLFLEPAIPDPVRQQMAPVGLTFQSGLIGTGAEWSPPFGWGTQFSPIVFLMASLAVMALIPKAGEIAKSLIAGKPISAGSAIGESLGYATGALGVASAFRDKRAQQNMSREELASKDPRLTDLQRFGAAGNAQQIGMDRQNRQFRAEALKKLWGK